MFSEAFGPRVGLSVTMGPGPAHPPPPNSSRTPRYGELKTIKQLQKGVDGKKTQLLQPFEDDTHDSHNQNLQSIKVWCFSDIFSIQPNIFSQ